MYCDISHTYIYPELLFSFQLIISGLTQLPLRSIHLSFLLQRVLPVYLILRQKYLHTKDYSPPHYLPYSILQRCLNMSLRNHVLSLPCLEEYET